MIKNLLVYGMAVAYLGAGTYHFVNPELYYALIPDYLPWPVLINVTAGVVEILFGLMILSPRLRWTAGWGVILMLLAFIPAHIHFIVENPCIQELCLPVWVGWVRLLVIHPLLIFYAWWVSKQGVSAVRQ